MVASSPAGPSSAAGLLAGAGTCGGGAGVCGGCEPRFATRAERGGVSGAATLHECGAFSFVPDEVRWGEVVGRRERGG